ncbi:hypothetical protein [Streptomyces sp. x-19]|uniref:hypothetical protein n=1 Tax=Streptomyces sp. x-19 TaxID=2789280 RepID=UPI00397EC2CC
MRFGVSTFLTDRGTAPTALARAVEERGLDSLFVAERTHIPVARRTPSPRGGELPVPVQRPHPPIYVGGGEGAFPRVAALGDAWLANGGPPGQLGPQITRMRNTAGRDVPVTVYGVPADHAVVEEYARLDVERLLFSLPTVPEPETLTHPDRFAEVAGRVR